MVPKIEILTGDELKTRINVIEYVGELCEDELYIEKAIFIDGDWEINEDLRIDSISELDNEADFLFINGNLNVKGDFNPEKETFPNMLLMGNLKASNIQNGEELLVVNGDVTVKNMIYGSYNHGGLKINGKTKAKYVINYDHWMIIPQLEAVYIISPFLNSVNLETDCLKYNLFENQLLVKIKDQYIIEDERWDEIENTYRKMKIVDIDQMVLNIRNGINIFKSEKALPLTE